jgi:CO/xanthine dehydrogenase Mo-binding subunit
VPADGEIDREHLIGASEMPFARPIQVLETDVVLDSGDYAQLLRKAQEAFGWDALQKQLSDRRAAGETVGMGLALFLEKSGLGPTDVASIALLASGEVELVTGAASLGQGVETVLAQICADAIGIAYTNVRVVHGTTNRIGKGFGSHASRTTVMTGSASHRAALNLKARILDAVQGRYDLPVEVLDIRDGSVVRTDVGGELVVSLADLAREKRLEAEGEFQCDRLTYPYGAHLAVVAVDRDTGGVEVRRYLVAYDIGRAINPMLVEGQFTGGVSQGIGGALF